MAMKMSRPVKVLMFRHFYKWQMLSKSIKQSFCPFCSSLLETKSLQSFYNTTPISLLVVKRSGRKTLLYQKTYLRNGKTNTATGKQKNIHFHCKLKNTLEIIVGQMQREFSLLIYGSFSRQKYLFQISKRSSVKQKWILSQM